MHTVRAPCNLVSDFAGVVGSFIKASPLYYFMLLICAVLVQKHTERERHVVTARDKLISSCLEFKLQNERHRRNERQNDETNITV